ncbi:MAG: flavodoxin domain-containing protein [Candidatus Nezhaarchaeales archaeon]
MKALVVCISMYYGNTEKIAKVIAEVLRAEIVKPHEVSAESLCEYDLIGFGSGIYFGKHHKSLFDLLDRIDYQHGKSAFIFSTSGIKASMFFDFHKALRKKLVEKGFVAIGEFNCKGFTAHPFHTKDYRWIE